MKKSRSWMIIIIIWGIIMMSYLGVAKELNAIFASMVGAMGMLYSMHHYNKLKELMNEYIKDVNLMVRRLNQIRETLGKE